MERTGTHHIDGTETHDTRAHDTQVALAGIDLTDLDRFTDGFPHETFALLRRDAPVWYHPPTAHTPEGEGFWVLSRWAHNHAAAADTETYSSDGSGVRGGGGGTLIEDLPSGFAAGVLLNMMDDPRHQRIRKVVTPSVSPRALAAMEAELRERTERIVDAVAAQGSCDFLVEVAAELPLQAIARLMGVPQQDRHRLFGWANASLDYDDRELGESSAKVQQAAAEMYEYGTWLVGEKRRCPADDILTAVAHADLTGEPDDRRALTDLELQMFFNLLIAAGSETTRNSIAVGLLACIEHPDEWRRLRDDRSLLPTAVEEILRYASTTAYNRRTATRDVELDGHLIRAGQKVTLWWTSANYDEEVFEDPYRFDVGRSPNKHLAFGHGSHFCLGANLARLEIKLVFEAMLDRFDAVQLTGPVEWTRSNKHTGLRHMPVAFTPRVRLPA